MENLVFSPKNQTEKDALLAFAKLTKIKVTVKELETVKAVDTKKGTHSAKKTTKASLLKKHKDNPVMLEMIGAFEEVKEHLNGNKRLQPA